MVRVRGAEDYAEILTISDRIGWSNSIRWYCEPLKDTPRLICLQQHGGVRIVDGETGEEVRELCQTAGPPYHCVLSWVWKVHTTTPAHCEHCLRPLHDRRCSVSLQALTRCKIVAALLVANPARSRPDACFVR
jgi:hypothetical protein